MSHDRGELLIIYKGAIQLGCGPMPNVMVALPNISGALCPTPQFGWRPHAPPIFGPYPLWPNGWMD